MKVGIYHERYGDNFFLGCSRYQGRENVTEIEMNLAPEVERAFALTAPIWSTRSNVPLLYLDEGNHGFDAGFVFWDGLQERSHVLGEKGKEAGLNFCKRELRVRVSFGRFPEHHEEDKSSQYTTARALDELDRLHISVYGGRQFFPLDWESVFSGGQYGKTEDPEITPLVEEAHVSLRWLREENGAWRYDDWSDVKTWMSEIDSKRLGRKCFSEGRTTYADSTAQNIQIGNREALSRDDILKLIDGETRKLRIFNANLRIERFTGPVLQAVTLLFYRGEHIPSILGYEELAHRLEHLPYKNEKDLCRLTPLQGVDFLFDKVMQGIEAFTEL